MTNRESDKDRAEHWRIRRRHLVLQADPWLKVWSEDLTLPDGREIDEFFNVEMPDYVVIVAITADGQIVTERGYKHGPRRVCISLPAGFVEPGETRETPPGVNSSKRQDSAPARGSHWVASLMMAIAAAAPATSIWHVTLEKSLTPIVAISRQ